jgi:dipeptidyl aminopeptidase/acylaminoacyl peptidase
MRPKLMLLCVFILATSGAVPVAAQSDTHPFSIHDMLAMDRLTEPQVSPDGKWVVFTLRKTDLAANRGRTDLWLVGTDGAGLRQLTTHPSGDSSPQWSFDGRSIYFLSTRSGTSQVWRLPVDGGEAEQKTSLPLDVGGFLLSPDDSRLALAVEVFPACENLACTKSKLEEMESRKFIGRIYDKLFIRHWDTWSDGRRSHLFVMPTAGGEPVDLMKGIEADSPSKPFGGMEEVAFTPDSKALVFTARVAGHEEAWSTNFDLYLVPVDGSAAPQDLTESNKAWDTQPVFRLMAKPWLISRCRAQVMRPIVIASCCVHGPMAKSAC